MTAREKAVALHKHFFVLIPAFTGHGQHHFLCKEAAKFCVDEIDNIIQKNTPKDDPYGNISTLEYWQEVKQEIEKL